MRDYTTEIPALERPFLAHEHPKWSDNLAHAWQQLKYWPSLRGYYKNQTAYSAVLTQANTYLAAALPAQLSAVNPVTQQSWLYQHVRLTSEYLLDAFCQHYASCNFTRACYPGWPAEQGIVSDAIEGVTRMIPLIAAYLVHAKQEEDKPQASTKLALDYQRLETYRQALRTCILHATDPDDKGYWGKIHDYSQLICEAHDVALAIWLTKDQIFVHLPHQDKQQILTWLQAISSKATVDNNWHLFIVLIQMVAADLADPIQKRSDYPFRDPVAASLLDNIDTQAILDGQAEQNLALEAPAGWKLFPEFYSKFVAVDKYQRVLDFYTNEGWWRDGAKGDYDFYNSWGFYYSLYWLEQIDPNFTGPFIKYAAQAWANKARYLFTPHSVAFFGRSVPYRLACSTGLLITDALAGQANGQHLRAFLSPNCYYISNQALAHGMVSAGFYGNDRRLQDPYSGPASAFWSLRSYIILLCTGNKTGAWTTDFVPLPVEQGDFQVEIPAIGLTITGNQETQEVVAQFASSKYKYDPATSKLLGQNSYTQLKEKIIGRSFRPKNNLLRKGFTRWSSKLDLYK
ncbi:DUF2264 domain-containing protein [Psittacicella hinzii]|uniref:DUF2264 domain-containing protein n=1 Tax=Psittacicella hinzii TaxID=2028575 RepID=A0A3A1YPQ7_9GAMM|nr:DUF2264 domain-containing protein [Psittacicella hinzii]RIY39595.1 hypothetical protein CKF58_01885 [Psittacicella hinzii]